MCRYSKLKLLNEFSNIILFCYPTDNRVLRKHNLYGALPVKYDLNACNKRIGFCIGSRKI